MDGRMALRPRGKLGIGPFGKAARILGIRKPGRGPRDEMLDDWYAVNSRDARGAGLLDDTVDGDTRGLRVRIRARGDQRPQCRPGPGEVTGGRAKGSYQSSPAENEGNGDRVQEYRAVHRSPPFPMIEPMPRPAKRPA